MSRRHKLYPFNTEQTVNILSEFGPLVTMFVVNAMYGINAGTWALISTTLIAIVAMFYMFGRPPFFPLIASTVTIVFGGLTLITKDPMWVQIKVTIFNAMFAAFLFIGLWLNKNFFKYVFDKTFHYTDEGWNTFTRSFAWFFLFTAFINEFVRIAFKDEAVYDVLGYAMNGVDIWIAFKLFVVLPLSGLFAWLMTRSMARHHLPEPVAHEEAQAETPHAAAKSAAAPES